jgi:hypothetical protein
VATFLQGFRCLGAIWRTGALLLALAVAGCSTLQDFAGVEHAGYQSNGTYVLSAQDKELGCRHLQERSDGLIEKMQALPALAAQEIQNAPSNIAALFNRAFGGSGDGLKAVNDYDRSHAEASALNAQLAEKGCGSTDIDAHLGKADEQMAFIKR